MTKNLVVAMRMQMESALIGGGSGLDDTFLGEMVAVTDAVVSALHAGQNGRALALIVDTTLKRHFAQTSQ